MTEYDHIATSRLIPYARNARTHSEAQVAQIAASIKEFGFLAPVVVDADYGIMAGHGRVLAARVLGLETVPCVRADHLTENQKRAYIIADNRLTETSEWDTQMLALEMEDLRLDDYNIDLTGFSSEALQELMDGGEPEEVEGLTDPDEVPELPPEPVSKAGDIWLLGKHRLMCGDSTDSDMVAKLLDGGTPHLMVTDPPYGVEYDADWRNHAFRSDGSASDGRAIGKVENDNRADWKDAWLLFGGDVAYVWHADLFSNVVADSLISCGFEPRALICWAKSNFAIGRGHYHHKHEPCWYMVKKGKTGHWSGDRSQTTLWDIAKPSKSETGHSTQKPLECMERPIRNNSEAGDSIYEPFSGSGTTIIAAEKTGRRCYAMELSPAYVDVAVKRWQDFTGLTATHADTGAPFGQ